MGKCADKTGKAGKKPAGTTEKVAQEEISACILQTWTKVKQISISLTVKDERTLGGGAALWHTARVILAAQTGSGAEVDTLLQRRVSRFGAGTELRKGIFHEKLLTAVPDGRTP